jgi:hypothetical protein
MALDLKEHVVSQTAVGMAPDHSPRQRDGFAVARASKELPESQHGEKFVPGPLLPRGPPMDLEAVRFAHMKQERRDRGLSVGPRGGGAKRALERFPRLRGAAFDPKRGAR